MRQAGSARGFLHSLLVLSCAALLVGATASEATAGVIAPELAAKLAAAAPDAQLSVLVRLGEQAPVEALRASGKSRGASLRERHREIVRALQATAESQLPLLDALAADKSRGEASVVRSFWIANVLSVTATPAVIRRIAARADVSTVYSNFRVRLIEPVEMGPGPAAVPKSRGGSGPEADDRVGVVPDGIRAIRAPEVWRDFGINGDGVLVANLDTGVDGAHPALRDRWRGRRTGIDTRSCWFNVFDESSTFPADNHGHGTHVMGTITGLGGADTIGVAWGAEWIAGKLLGPGKTAAADSSDLSAGDDVMASYQWFADPDGNPDTDDDVPDVVQNSWGTDIREGSAPCDSTWWEAIDNCEAAGVVVTWSAGNSGPGSMTLLVPADRATSPTRNFSVGAVKATEANWPYGVAGFSSRGPSFCTADGRPAMKPEVVAPGVGVYSSLPGGRYEGGWSGTSMAGPHVAGVVALLRQADPDLDPDMVKQILMETARPLDPEEGENNEWGWGFIDAYAAVSRVLSVFGHIEGTVWNASVPDLSVSRAEIAVQEAPYQFHSNAAGRFHASLPAADFHLIASAAGFAPETLLVSIPAGRETELEFHLRDIAPPEFQPIAFGGSTADTLGPYTLRVQLFDPSGVAHSELHFRTDAGPWLEFALTATQGGAYQTAFPGASAGTTFEYYCAATDRAGNESVWPPGAPETPAVFQVRKAIYATSFEASPEAGWEIGATGDHATSGVWVQADPVGTLEKGTVLQTEDDHTPDDGAICFVTGNGQSAGSAGDADVDFGCTTLLSPLVDLRGESEAYASYARWFNMGRLAPDDTLFVDVSADSGRTWTALERVGAPDSVWHVVDVALHDKIPLTSGVRVRFVTCDRGLPGLTEAALDDFSIQGFTRRVIPSPDSIPPGTVLLAPTPNPSRGSASIRFRLAGIARGDVGIFDVLGRRVRRVVIDAAGGENKAGRPESDADSAVQVVSWDGRDDAGRAMPSGLYWIRLRAGGVTRVRPLVLLR